MNELHIKLTAEMRSQILHNLFRYSEDVLFDRWGEFPVTIRPDKSEIYDGLTKLTDEQLMKFYNHVEKKYPSLDMYVSDTGYYNIGITWTSYATIQVKADNLAEAVEKARNADFALPKDNVSYLDDSYAVCAEDMDEALAAAEHTTVSEVILD